MQAPVVRNVNVNVTGPYRYRVLDSDYLITNDFGDWLFLKPNEFGSFAEGTLSPQTELYERLRKHRFIHGEYKHDETIKRYQRLTWFLHYGPRFHIIALTERGSVESTDTAPDMTIETVEQALDCAFMSTNPEIVLRFTGGEPMLNWDVLTHAVQYAEDKNRLARKRLHLEVETDLTLMDEERLEWLASKAVVLHVRLTDDLLAGIDGTLGKWITAYHQATDAHGLDAKTHHVRLYAEMHQGWLKRIEDIVDLASELDCRCLSIEEAPRYTFLLPANPLPDYTVDEWLSGYDKALDRCIYQWHQGNHIAESCAQTLLGKILGPRDPDDYRVRSPASEGIGQLAYHVDGRVFTSDAGRRIALLTGDELFQIGRLRFQGYHDMITSPTVRALVVASVLEGQPGYVDWVYKPFCGLSPTHNYAEQGSIHGRMQESSFSRRLEGILDLLFRRIHREDPSISTVFQTWAEYSSQPT